MEWCRNWRKHEKTGWQVSRCGSMAPCPCISNFKTRFFDKLARTLRRWQGPDMFSFDYSRPWDVRPRFYASVRDRLEWIGWKRTENTSFRPFTWQCIFVRIRKQPDTLAIITTTTSNRVLTHFPSIIRDFFSFLLFSSLFFFSTGTWEIVENFRTPSPIFSHSNVFRT